MNAVLGILYLFLIVIIGKCNHLQSKFNKNETFITYIQWYVIDGEGYQQEVWEVTKKEDL